MQMELPDFPPLQRSYLNLLTKFTGRTNRVKLLQASDMSKKKEIIISENLVYLSTSEIVDFNDCKLHLKDSIAYCKGVFLASFLAGGVFYIMRTPTTRSLWPGFLKSVFLGGGLTLAFYQYNYWEYQHNLQRVYIKLLKKKKTMKSSI